MSRNSLTNKKRWYWRGIFNCCTNSIIIWCLLHTVKLIKLKSSEPKPGSTLWVIGHIYSSAQSIYNLSNCVILLLESYLLHFIPNIFTEETQPSMSFTINCITWVIVILVVIAICLHPVLYNSNQSRLNYSVHKWSMKYLRSIIKMQIENNTSIVTYCEQYAGAQMRKTKKAFVKY